MQADYYAVADQRFLGTARFVDEWQARHPEEPSARPGQSLARALRVVAAELGVAVAQLQSGDRSWAVSRQRTVAAYLLIRRGGYRPREIAAALHRDPATVSTLLTRFAARLADDPITQRDIERLAKKVKI